RRDMGRAPPPVPAASSATGLSNTEMEDLVAFGEVLVGGEALGPAERRFLVEHIADRIRRTPEYLSLYQTTVSTLDRLAGQSFATLAVEDRIDLIARHGLARSPEVSDDAASDDADDDPQPAELREVRTVRQRVAPDLIRGYYASPAGWAVVGYETFPGRCGD